MLFGAAVLESKTMNQNFVDAEFMVGKNSGGLNGQKTFNTWVLKSGGLSPFKPPPFVYESKSFQTLSFCISGGAAKRSGREPETGVSAAVSDPISRLATRLPPARADRRRPHEGETRTGPHTVPRRGALFRWPHILYYTTYSALIHISNTSITCNL